MSKLKRKPAITTRKQSSLKRQRRPDALQHPQGVQPWAMCLVNGGASCRDTGSKGGMPHRPPQMNASSSHAPESPKLSQDLGFWPASQTSCLSASLACYQAGACARPRPSPKHFTASAVMMTSGGPWPCRYTPAGPALLSQLPLMFFRSCMTTMADTL